MEVAQRLSIKNIHPLAAPITNVGSTSCSGSSVGSKLKIYKIPMNTTSMTPYEKLGGETAIRTLVHRFY